MGPKDHVHCGCRKQTTAKIQYILIWLREAALFSTFKLLSTKLLLTLRDVSNWLLTLFSKPVEVTPKAKMQAYSWTGFKFLFVLFLT